MAEQLQAQAQSEWKHIPPTPPTTFPTRCFVAYALIAVLLLPIHLIVCAVNGIFKLIMFAVNFLFYQSANRLLLPITPSPDAYVVITGAASGIGKDTAALFAQKGFSLILVDIASTVQSYAEQLSQQHQSQTFKPLVCDLSRADAASNIYDTIINQWNASNVVVLVNCAGFGYTGEFLNQNMDKLRCMILVNSVCCIELAHKFGRYFVQRGVGRICQIASVAAFIPGSHAAVYHGTKAMVRSWAIALQHELIGTGVGVTVVCPGPVKTNFVQNSNSTKSLIFGALSWFAYEPMDVAKAAVCATMNGKRQVVYGPLWHCIQNILSVYGEAFNIIASKFMWQDPNSVYRSPFKKHNV